MDSPGIITSFAAVVLLLIILHRHCFICAKPVLQSRLPRTPDPRFAFPRRSLTRPSSKDQIISTPDTPVPRVTSLTPSKAAISRPQDGGPNLGANTEPHHFEHIPAVRRGPLIWIPIPRLRPPPSSLCERRGSVLTALSEDASHDIGGDLLASRAEHLRPDLLSGVGGQFAAAGLGRRLSWLVWSDAAVEDSAGAYGCRGDTAM